METSKQLKIDSSPYKTLIFTRKNNPDQIHQYHPMVSY